MYFAYLYIYSYILWYTDIYYFNKVYTGIFSYVFCISVYILLYTVIYGHILLQQSIYSYILVCTLYICVYTTEFLTQGLSLGLGLVLFLKSNAIVYLEMSFLRKQCYRTSGDMRKLGYFITLVRGCPGSQLSKGFEINEDILRYATVHTLIYACFLMCIWTPLESWLPEQPLEIIYVCVYQLVYGRLLWIFCMEKKMRKMQCYTEYIQGCTQYKSVYTDTRLCIHRWNLYIWAYTHMSKYKIVYTLMNAVYLRTSPYIRVYMRMWHFAKTCMTRRFELGISCILQGCSDHYATSVDTKRCIVWYMYAKLRFKFEPRCLLADVGRPVLSRQHPRASYDGWFRKAGFQV